MKKANVSLVEIDLLRAGKRVFAMPVSRVPRKHRTVYQACVRRGWRPTVCEIYPISLRSTLPVLRIPLRPKDDDVPLNLQAVVQETYVKGAYGKTVNYAKPPVPPLADNDAEWAKQLVRAAAK